MIRIGYIDYFLDEWHAENYPAWIAGQAKELGLEAQVTCAYGEIDAPGGLTNAQWCEKHKIQLCDCIEDVISRSDALIVLSPNHSEHHERLSQLALQSGKPVYVDKTFAPDLATARRMFELAEKHRTPLFSASALRFSLELEPYIGTGQVDYMLTTGPGEFDTYAIHQIEMLVALLGADPQEVMALEQNDSRQLLIRYPDRTGSLLQMAGLDFQVRLSTRSGEVQAFDCSLFFERLIADMIRFFDQPQAVVPVAARDTLACMALLESGRKALDCPGQWIAVEPV